jgi:hypothetical protein
MTYAGSKMELELLKSLVVLFGTSALVAFVLDRLKIPKSTRGILYCLQEKETPWRVL